VHTPDIHKTLENAGIHASAFERIRLPRGVVGKASYVAAFAIVGLAIVAWGLKEPIFLLIDAALIVVLFVVFLFGILWFANKHPGLALLEGAELIQWRQLDIAASDAPMLPDMKMSEASPIEELPKNE
jgi:hypothetical protein